MLSKDEDILKAVEDWRGQGRVLRLPPLSRLGVGAASSGIEPCNQRRGRVSGVQSRAAAGG